jgi:hypothetical protein
MLKWIAWPCISDVLTVLRIGREQEVCRTMSRPKTSFWTSLPVFLTALGTLIGASAGLIALFASTNGGKTPASASISATPTPSHLGHGRTGVRLGTGVSLGGTGGDSGEGGGNSGGTGVFPTPSRTRPTHSASPHPTPNPSPTPSSSSLGTPIQVSPADGALFTNFPRDTTVTWQATTGAASYLVEVQCLDCVTVGEWSPWASTTTTDTSFGFTWVGDNYGRWRVSAIGADGTQGPPSGWRQFDYKT